MILPPEQAASVVSELQKMKGILSISLQRGTGIKPAGDVLSVEITSRSLNDLMHLLDSKGITVNPEASFSSAMPASVVSSKSARSVELDTSEATWEEMEMTLLRESNPTANVLGLMMIAGFIAVIGISTGALHIVLASMVIAPGFEPFVRISLGAINRSNAWKHGFSSAALGYAALLLGAVAAALLLRAEGSLFAEEGKYVSPDVLISYWSTITLPSLLVSAVASVAGALLVASHRSVLTAGVMIALALIPSAALTGSAMIAGEWHLAGKAGLRWISEIILVIALSILVFAWKRLRVHRRKMVM
jgi:uncharacterized membrane protein